MRPLFADLLRAVGAVDGIRRVRFTSPHPKDLRPETIAAMAETPRRVRAPAPARCSRAATACWRRCTAATPPSATSSGWPRPARAVARPGGHHRHHRRLPRRDRRRLRAHARGRRRGRVRQRLHVHLLAPARHRGGRAWSTTSSPADVSRGALRAAARRGRALARCAKHEARVGRVEEVLVEGPSKKDPSVMIGPHPPEQARALRARRRRSGRARYADGRDHRARRRTTSAASFVELHAPRPRTAPASRWSRAEHVTRRTVALVGPTASGKSALALAVAASWRRTSRSSSVDSMQVYRGMDIGTAKPTAGRAARSPAPPHRRRRSGRGVHGRRVPARSADAALADIEARGAARAARRRHRALPAGGRRRVSIPGRVARRSASRARVASATVASLHARLDALDPVAAVAHRRRQPAPGRAGARGVARQRPAVLVVRPRAHELRHDRRSPRSACAVPRPVLTERIARALRRADGAPGSSTRSRALATRPGGLSRTARQALGYAELLAHLDGVTSARRRDRRWPITPHPPVRRAARALVPPRPADHVARRDRSGESGAPSVLEHPGRLGSMPP